MKKKDSISALFWLVISLLILTQAGQLPFGTLSHPMPGFFPSILGAVLGILSLALLGKSLSKGDGEESGFPLGRKSWERVGLTLGSALVYYMILEKIGFLLAAFVLVFILIKFIEPQQWLYSTWMSALISLCSYLLFQVLLKANLPPGITRGLGF
jgi:putative tricarboxylic transport membrane protein